MVKSIVLSVIFFTVCAVFFTGQGNEPLLLKSPRDWKFERIDFPPGFAPDLDYKGFEELRFGPGMFDKKAEFYFSYVFAIVLKNTDSSEVDLKDFLYKYYKGLISVVAQQKKMSVDLSQIKVKARKMKPSATPYPLYDVDLTIVDPFTDGKTLDLNMEIQVIPWKAEKGTCLFCIASPKAKETGVWKKLCSIRDTFIKQCKN